MCVLGGGLPAAGHSDEFTVGGTNVKPGFCLEFSPPLDLRCGFSSFPGGSIQEANYLKTEPPHLFLIQGLTSFIAFTAPECVAASTQAQ